MTTKTRSTALQQLIEDSAQRTYDEWRAFERDLRQFDDVTRGLEPLLWLAVIVALVAFGYIIGLR
jgi:hypothetical protein